MSYLLPNVGLGSNNRSPNSMRLSQLVTAGSHAPSPGIVLLGNSIIGPDRRNTSAPTLANQGLSLQSYNFASQPQLQIQPQIQLPAQYSLPMIDGQGNPQMGQILYSAPSLAGNGLNQRISQVPAFNVGSPGGQPYYMQPIYIQSGDNNQSPDKKKKKKKKDRKKKKGSLDDYDDDEDNEKDELDGKGMKLIEKYLDKQNQLMNRILRDINDDKKLEQLRNNLNNRPDNDFSNDMGYPASQRKLRNPLLSPFKSAYPEQSFREEDEDAYQPTSPQPYMHPFAQPQKKANNPPQSSSPKKSNPTAKIRARRMIRQFTWSIALPGLWFISVVKWAEQRRDEELNVLSDEIPENLEIFLEFAAGAVGKELSSFINEKGSMVVVQKGAVKPAEMDKRCKTIADHLIVILDNLSLHLDSGKLPSTFFEFLAAVSENDATIPETFLSGYELVRLNFNLFKNLKSMTEWQTKMVLGAFILLKGILHFLMLRPWATLSNIQEKNVNIKNMFNAGSVLYHVSLELFDDFVKELNPSKSGLQFQVTAPNFNALDPKNIARLDVPPPQGDDDEIGIINGFYSREQLSPFLQERPKMVDEVKDAIIDFLDVLFEKSHKALEPKWHVKKRFIAHRPR